MPITQRDVDDYGIELIDMTQRAAAQAVAPHLQELQGQTAALAREVAVERRKRLDLQVEQAVPNFREIDQDPGWHRWLSQIDPLNGVRRQDLLNSAVARGDIYRVIAFFRSWQNEYHASQASAPTTSRGRSSSSNGRQRTYDNESIKELYAQRRKGLIPDDQWVRIEADIFAAQREGRVNARPFWTK